MNKLLVANRGEIALRIIRAAKNLGIQTVAIFSEIDRSAPHVKAASEAYCVGPASALESYLNQEKILDVLTKSKADAVHPGYGFLSENPSFAEAVAKQGAIFVGPPASAMKRLGHKDEARKIAENAGVPVVPGYHGEKQDPETLIAAAKKIGFPCILKARAGGGGKGMRLLESDKDITQQIEAAKREAASSFGDERLIVEKFVSPAKHIEVQLLADNHGHILHLYERECSLQRRHQKVIEEAPAPEMDAGLREKMVHAAQALASSAGLVNASTVEFLVPCNSKDNDFYFLEVNCRVQVEHPVTELVTGLDIVELQLRIARGEKLPITQKDVDITGSAIEARVYAELPAQHFIPSTGTISTTNITQLEKDGARVDHALESGTKISTYYDPMLAKVICHGESRKAALNKLKQALKVLNIDGVETNQVFLNELLAHPSYVSGDVSTSFIDSNIDALVSSYSSNDTFVEACAIFLFSLFGPSCVSTTADPFYTSSAIIPSSASSIEKQVFFNPTCKVSVKSFSTGSTVVLEAKPVSLHYSSGTLTCEIAGEVIEIAGLANGFELNGKYLVARYNMLSGSSSPQVGTSISISGHSFVARFATADKIQGDADGADSTEIISPLPGKLVRVDASPGQSVQAGDTLCVIESMKMEHSLRAPRDVVIDEVLLNPGDSVNEGQRIIVFATS